MRATAKQCTPLSRPAQLVVETEIEVLEEAIQLVRGVKNDPELRELHQLHATLLPVLEQNASALRSFIVKRGSAHLPQAG
jgi:hypothetical protein